MIRTSAPTWLVFGAASLAAAAAVAEPTSTTTSSPETSPAQTGQRVVVPTPAEAFVPHAQISSTLYLERCIGDCTINGGGINDARTNTSSIPSGPGPYTIAEFRGSGGSTGTAADADWNAVVACVKEVYSPFNVVVTDQKPAPGVSYHMAIVAGTSANIGLPPEILGIAPARPDCSPSDNVISFSFANAHPGSGTERNLNLCWTASQESAHAFGIPNHSWAFADGRSACNDPMTYRTDCGGQKFFRNEQATCGDFSQEPSCACGPTHNTHLKLQSVFGPGQATTGAPTAVVTLPLANTQLGAVVAAQAGSKRGVAKVELILNGFKWAEVKGAAFGPNGQANPSNYTITVPANVPGGVIDVVARAYDDLGAYTDSAPVTVTKGVPCTSADTCAKGQKCEAGKCFWDPPSGEIGADCTYNEFCVSGLCQGTADQQICTQNCIPGVTDSCPDGLICAESAPGKGVCFFSPDSGGCCSVGDDGGSPWVPAALGATLLGLIALRPRRRRR